MFKIFSRKTLIRMTRLMLCSFIMVYCMGFTVCAESYPIQEMKGMAGVPVSSSVVNYYVNDTESKDDAAEFSFNGIDYKFPRINLEVGDEASILDQVVRKRDNSVSLKLYNITNTTGAWDYNGSISFTSGDPLIVSTQKDVLKAIKPGNTTVSLYMGGLNAGGNKSDLMINDIPVTVSPYEASMDLNASSGPYDVGDEFSIVIGALADRNLATQNVTIKVENNNPDVLEFVNEENRYIDENGTLYILTSLDEDGYVSELVDCKVIGQGDVSITASMTLDNNPEWLSECSATNYFTVGQFAKLVFNTTEIQYDGNEKTLSYKVVDFGGSLLQEGTDYKCYIKQGDEIIDCLKEVGNYTFVVEGLGGYEGKTIERNFEITKGVVEDKEIDEYVLCSKKFVEINKTLPNKPGNLTFEKVNSSVPDGASVRSWDVTDRGTINCSIDKYDLNDPIKFRVKVSSQNYEDYYVDANIYVSHDTSDCEEYYLYTKEPTCEDEGYTGISYCKRCDEFIGNGTIIPPLEHDFNINYIWSDDYSECTAYAECTREGCNVTREETVFSEEDVDRRDNATCSVEGKRVYVATFEDSVFETQEKEVTIPKKPHNYNINYTWADDGSSCMAEAICSECYDEVTNDADITSEVIVEPTETSKGKTTYTATFPEGSPFTTQTKDVDIPAIDHHNYNITYTWSDDGSSCTATAACTNKDCNEKVTETVKASLDLYRSANATCTKEGAKVYIATFENSVFTTQEKNVNIPAKGHSYDNINYTWAEDGSLCSAETYCSYCYSNVSKFATITSVVKEEPTETSKGITTYTATFPEDSPFTTQTKNIEDIPAIDHHNYIISYTWPKDGSSCTATATCKNKGCNDVVEETVKTTSVVKTEATDTKKGTTTYTAKFSDTTLFETQTKDIVDIPANGHNYEVEYTWSEDGSSCTATATCKNKGCNDVVEETVKTTSVVKTKATDTEKGTTTYTAKFSDTTLFKTQTKDIQDIPIEEKDPDQKDPDQKDPDQKDPDQKDPDQKDPDQKDPDQKDPDQKDPDQQPATHKSEWFEGKWYNADGTQDYEATGSWYSDSTGYWFMDTSGWYPVSSWQLIDGYWYYFNASGYMASNEWVDGYWLNADGSCTYEGTLTWHSDETGWWVESSDGWYPSGTWQRIDGVWYYFLGSGYMAANQYVDGYWIGADGACN